MKVIQQHLAQDPVLKPLVEQVLLKDREAQASVYEALLRAINFQQLSGKAASTIHNRFLALFPNQYPDPELIIQLTPEELRAVGVSRQKASYVQNVARFFIEKNLHDHAWDDDSDQEILDLLTQIKGVGNWTVEMILMFTLHRPDVLPLDDLVIKNAMVELYQVKETGRALNPKLLEIAEAWRPYRTWASRYLWQWRDTII